jgi:serine/threonine-protein kinase
MNTKIHFRPNAIAESHGKTLPYGGPLPNVTVPLTRPLTRQRSVDALAATAPADRQSADLAGASGRGTVLPKLVLAPGRQAPQLESTNRPRYREESRLGAGGLGEVTLAIDEDIGRHVAIKRLHHGDNQDSLMRFVDEVQVMGRLDHPNIVPVHDVGCDQNNRLYFVMKRLESDTLEAIIERLRDGDAETHRRYPLAVRYEIMMSILRALQFAHAQKIIHRDLKPSNIMIGRFGEVAVVDWGIAKRLDDPLSAALDATTRVPDEVDDGVSARRPFRTRVGTLLGTPAYMSPEQARGDNHLLDERSDIFSISVVFYEFLTLRHPFDGKTDLKGLLEAIRSEEAPPIVAYTSASQRLSVELSNFVQRGLAKEREDRYATIGEMLETLHEVVDGSFPITCPVTLVKQFLLFLTRLIDRHPMATARGVMLTALLSVLGILGGLGWVAWSFVR